MAQAPTAAPPPVDPGAAAPPPDAGDEGDQPMVLATILKNPDGGFQLIAGDEEEAGEDMGGEGGGGAEPGAGEGEAEAAPMGKSYDSVGALLAAVHEIVMKDQDGGASAKDQMAAGFGTPPAPAPAG